MAHRESPCDRLWETGTHQETRLYEIQEDCVTDWDDAVLPFNDECTSLEEIHINTEKSVYMEQKVAETAS